MVEWLIYSPDTTHSVRAALVVVVAVLVATVEVLFPRVPGNALSTTPIAHIRETADCGLVTIQSVEFIFRRQIPTASHIGTGLESRIIR